MQFPGVRFTFDPLCPQKDFKYYHQWKQAWGQKTHYTNTDMPSRLEEWQLGFNENSNTVLSKHVAINQQDIKASTMKEGLSQLPLNAHCIFSGCPTPLVLTTILNLLYRYIQLLWLEWFFKDLLGNLMLTL